MSSSVVCNFALDQNLIRFSFLVSYSIVNVLLKFYEGNLGPFFDFGGNINISIATDVNNKNTRTCC